jgi:hypothetical protein
MRHSAPLASRRSNRSARACPREGGGRARSFRRLRQEHRPRSRRPA